MRSQLNVYVAERSTSLSLMQGMDNRDACPEHSSLLRPRIDLFRNGAFRRNRLLFQGSRRSEIFISSEGRGPSGNLEAPVRLRLLDENHFAEHGPRALNFLPGPTRQGRRGGEGIGPGTTRTIECKVSRGTPIERPSDTVSRGSGPVPGSLGHGGAYRVPISRMSGSPGSKADLSSSTPGDGPGYYH
jgi:hypothetical protein